MEQITLISCLRNQASRSDLYPIHENGMVSATILIGEKLSFNVPTFFLHQSFKFDIRFYQTVTFGKRDLNEISSIIFLIFDLFVKFFCDNNQVFVNFLLHLFTMFLYTIRSPTCGSAGLNEFLQFIQGNNL